MNGLPEHHEVAIIGGGPAGMSAAIWCADLGLKPLVLERSSELGGQLLWTYNPIENYLGLEAANGRELRDRFLKSLGKFQIAQRRDVQVVAADLKRHLLTFTDGESIVADSIIIATGVRRRQLGVPGEGEFLGRGILDSGAASRAEVAGKRVVIVGGGDAAFENASILADSAEHVTVVHRRSLSTSRSDFVEAASAAANIELMPGCRVLRIGGGDKVEWVELETGGQSVRLDADFVLIRIGVEPNCEMFRGQIEFDELGFVVVDSHCRTDAADVYAIGDVANSASPTIAAAVGQGTVAAKAIKTKINTCSDRESKSPNI
ncbi:MAG: NAD(P)/FAD-dependent oxidoreductase [Pyrinomonadaceae bacterium]